MSNVKFTLAMLAVGGLSATAAHAVTPITVELDIPDNGNQITPINLVGGPGNTAPQFYYGSVGSPPVLLTGEFTSDAFFKGLLTYQYGAVGDKSSTNPGFPLFSDVGGPYTFVNAIGPTYFQLAFQNGGLDYVGYAYVDSSETLEYITYEPVPEPAAWALLIAGVGLAGAAVRTRRRKELAQAA